MFSFFLKDRNDTLILKDFSKELFDVHFRGYFIHYHLNTCRVLMFRKVAEIAGFKIEKTVLAILQLLHIFNYIY